MIVKSDAWRAARLAGITLVGSLTALLLAGCVPLDEPTPGPDTAETAASLTPTAEPTNWDDCGEPTISHAEPAEKGWRIIGAMELKIQDGSRSTTEYFTRSLAPSIVWEGSGQPSDRFTEQISEVIEYPTTRVIVGHESVADMFQGVKDPGTTLGYRAVEEISVPITLSCGDLVAFGTVNTWMNNETGIIDCSLPAEGEPELPSNMVRKQWCPDQGSN